MSECVWLSTDQIPALSNSSCRCSFFKMWSKIIKWKISEVNNCCILNYTPFWVVGWNLIMSCSNSLGYELPLCLVYPSCPTTYLYSVATLVTKLTFIVFQCLCSSDICITCMTWPICILGLLKSGPLVVMLAIQIC